MNQQISKIRLGINIDHVATLRNARGGNFPCPIQAAKLAQKAGADGITAHLREDRRHIKDKDIERLRSEVTLPLNFEMAPTDEMLKIALKIQPNAVCLVPEKRQELTTEGGLDVVKNQEFLRKFIEKLKIQKIRVSLFVDANLKQIEISQKIGADIVEIHTGSYCLLPEIQQEAELQKISNCIKYAYDIGLECHAGHGLDYHTAKEFSKISQIVELNIGHFLISDAIFIGLESAIVKMKESIKR